MTKFKVGDRVALKGTVVDVTTNPESFYVEMDDSFSAAPEGLPVWSCNSDAWIKLRPKKKRVDTSEIPNGYPKVALQMIYYYFSKLPNDFNNRDARDIDYWLEILRKAVEEWERGE